MDANYFQHVPYLDEEKKAKGYKFSALNPVHLEPLGVYSKKVKNLADVPQGAVVAIPNDPSNSGRALNLLATNAFAYMTSHHAGFDRVDALADAVNRVIG